MADFKTMTKHMQQLALQHNIGSGERLPSTDGQQSNITTDADDLVRAFINKMNLNESSETSCEASSDSDDSNMEVNPTHNFDDLARLAHSFKTAAISTHLIAANLRNYFKQNNLTEHHSTASYIARDLCLRRIDAVVIECQATDHIERKGGPQASTPAEKQRLRRMFEQAEDGIATLGALEMELIELFTICKWCDPEGDQDDTPWGAILVELMRIEDGGGEEREHWIDTRLNHGGSMLCEGRR